MNKEKLVILITTFFLSNPTVSIAGVSKFYDDLIVGECSDDSSGVRRDETLIKNAMSHAHAWCRTSGGVKRGDEWNDYITATEGTSPYFCRIKGTIECNN